LQSSLALLYIALMKPIAILGGTFDPIHNGHLYLANAVAQKFNFNKTKFIPCHTPPHRKKPIASTEQRIAMLEIAIKGNQFFELDDLEIKKGGVSYTIETLKLLREQLPDTPLCLIMGDDEFQSFVTWQKWDEILNYCHLIVVKRLAGKEEPLLPELTSLLAEKQTSDNNDLAKNLAGKIIQVEINALPISATKIRGLIKKGKSITGLVPTAVEKYIAEQGLYL
jgi:nicotinate-nucleotide adenylyltransferase